MILFASHFIVTCSLLLASLHHVAAKRETATRGKKTLMLFGIAGVGKSTLSNCLLKQRGDMASIHDGGFQVSEDAGSGTLHFELKSNDQLTIIDSIGFGSPDFNASYILAQMRGVLNKVNNRIDLVLFVIKKGRLTNDTYQFIRTFQEDVLRNASRTNSVLVVNQCERGWLDKPAQRSNPFMTQILASVNHMAFEFDLKMDHYTDEEETTRRNAALRQHSIDRLVQFIQNVNVTDAISMAHIQTAEFEASWLRFIYSVLESLARIFLTGFSFKPNKLPDSMDAEDDFSVPDEPPIGSIPAPSPPPRLRPPMPASHRTEQAHLQFVSVYEPTQKSIYLITITQPSDWRVYEPLTGHFRPIKNPLNITLTTYAYSGGVYSPELERIFLVPFNQPPSDNWHYIDCFTKTLVAYSVPKRLLLTSFAYVRGVYSPVQRRIYLVPYNQQHAEWHYIDCKSARVDYVEAFALRSLVGAYSDGVYSPVQRRIYLVPQAIASRPRWHYIDCDTGKVVEYEAQPPKAKRLDSQSYNGGVYAPNEDRVYLIPNRQAPAAEWHYIDCASSTLVAYKHSVKSGFELAEHTYLQGVYTPELNRIYIAPYRRAERSRWLYIDCATATVGTFSNQVEPTLGAIQAIAYVPQMQRVVLVAHQYNYFHVLNINPMEAQPITYKKISLK